METNFKIPKFINNNNSFEKIGYDEYCITYLKGLKVHELRIVVNGYLTKQSINIIDFSSGYNLIFSCTYFCNSSIVCIILIV